MLHVANGSSTTDTMKVALLPGTTSIWADPLYDGPVPGDLADEELVEVRAQFLSGSRRSAEQVLDALTEWRRVIQNHESYDELVLWFEHDLFDQLNLIQLLTWARTELPSDKPVSLICINSFPGRSHFKGLGELTPVELASLFPTRRPVSDAQYMLAERAWDAFREPTPEALDALRRSDTNALPFLAAALTRFLQEYPWTSDGLSRSERRLLTLAADGGIALTNAFPRMQDGEHAYYITDGSIDALVDDLSRSSTALLTSTPSDSHADRPLQRSVAITATGREVLAGRRDRIVTCGIDRWLGGVHLSRDEDVWRWDEKRDGVVQI